MSSVVHRLPAPVLAESTSAASRVYIATGGSFDYAIGGLPFNSAASPQRPIARVTAQVQKQQTDTSREPGEHTLAFWWLKAQSSFHGGAGQKYLGSADTDNEGISRYRFADSEGLDVFTQPGAVTLLPQTSRFYTTAGNPLVALTDQGYLYLADGPGMLRYSMSPQAGQPDSLTSPMDFTSGTVAWGSYNSILSLTTDGSSYYIATTDGIYTGSGLGAATKIYTYPTGSVPLLRYVKQRLMLGISRAGATPAVYELDPKAAANSALPTALFTGTSTWVWTEIVESPSAILIAGNNGARSAIYKVGLNTSTTVPTLLPGVVSAEMPAGELITGMATYLGTALGLQTTAGFRVGILNASGDFQYGGLLFEHARNASSSGVFGVGNSLYAGKLSTRGNAGLARVDLSNTIGSGQGMRFPWAPDIWAADAAGSVSAALLWNYGRKVFIVAGAGAYVQTHVPVATGTLVTSRIRWDTLEGKLLRLARLRGEGAGMLTLEVARNSDTAFSSVGVVDLSARTDSDDMLVQLPAGQFFTLRLTLSGGGTLSGYQLKALPAQRRQRTLQLPLACYDREVDNSGLIGGGQGSAMSRLLALETLEQTNDVVALQWLSVYPEQELTEYVTIEQVQFEQTASASDSKGWGGIVTLTVRTVA